MKARISVAFVLGAAVALIGVGLYVGSERVGAPAASGGGPDAGFVLANHQGPVVVTVDGLAITQGDIDRALVQMPEAILSYPEDRVRDLVLNQLINNRLLLIAGLGQGLDGDPDVALLVSMYRAATIAQAYMETYTSAEVTDEAVAARYGETLGNPDLQREVHARHILVDNEAAALELIAELTAGADFAALAQAHSIGPSASTGGDLGFFRLSTVATEFADAVATMRPGDVSTVPVQTEFGWHVVSVEAFRDPELPPLEAIRDQLAAELTNEAIVAHLEILKDAADIVYLDE